MKYLKQFLIIAAVSFAGEMLHMFVNLPVPASIYGMALMFLLLETGLLKLSAVKETARFLTDIMPVMFVPSAVGILESWDIIRPSLLSYLLVTVLVTVIVMAAAGSVTQLVMGAQRNKAGLGIAAAMTAGENAPEPVREEKEEKEEVRETAVEKEDGRGGHRP